MKRLRRVHISHCDAVPDNKKSKLRKVAILFLTIDAPSNGDLWRDWAAADPSRCNFYVNAKTAFSEFAFINRISDPVTDTEWGDHSLVWAHQALLRHALAHDAANSWFCLVSGDSIPIVSLDSLLHRFESLQSHDSLLGQFVDENMTVFVGSQVQAFYESGIDTKLENWWVSQFAAVAEDKYGVYCGFDVDSVRAHSQFIMLSRLHAHWLAQMPDRVSRDFDVLLKDVRQYKPLAADETVPFSYLNWQLSQQEGAKGRLLDIDIMFAPVDRTGYHAKKHHVAISTKEVGHLTNRWFFARKFNKLGVDECNKVKDVWTKRI